MKSKFEVVGIVIKDIEEVIRGKKQTATIVMIKGRNE